MAAMREKHLPLEGVQVRLSVPMSATTIDPLLEVKSLVMTTQYQGQARVVCRKSLECLPFYVSVSWPESSAGPAIPAEVLRRFHRSINASAESGAHQSTNERGRKEGQQSEEALKAGSSATLIIDENRIHIRLKVVCLQGGAAGDKVRVSTPDHKQAYVGEVVTPTLLKGSL